MSTPIKGAVPTVYVVDDDASIRELIIWLMRANGIAVMAFSSAQAFLDVYQSDAPGCLILDLYMPGMSGLDLQQYLNAHGISMPVIFLSGQADVRNAVAAVKFGAIDFIEKPFDYKRIVPLIHDCLQRDAALRQARGRNDSNHVRLARLTQREREVLDQIVNGNSDAPPRVVCRGENSVRQVLKREMVHCAKCFFKPCQHSKDCAHGSLGSGMDQKRN